MRIADARFNQLIYNETSKLYGIVVGVRQVDSDSSTTASPTYSFIVKIPKMSDYGQGTTTEKQWPISNCRCLNPEEIGIQVPSQAPLSKHEPLMEEPLTGEDRNI